MVNNLQADLQALCPGLLEITGEASNQWFLNFLLRADTLPQLARLKRRTLLKIPSVGVKSAAIIEGWQKRCHFSQEVQWVGEMIQEDAKRCLELDEKIKRLEAKIAEVAKGSNTGKYSAAAWWSQRESNRKPPKIMTTGKTQEYLIYGS